MTNRKARVAAAALSVLAVTLFTLIIAAPIRSANFFYPVTAQIKQWYDTHGAPLSNGYIYFGAANQNPQASPITMYWDAAGLIPAAQPFRTSGGFVLRQGTPANVYAAGDFSCSVYTSNGSLVFTVPRSVDLQLALSIAGASSAAAIPIADAGSYYTTDNVEAAFQQLGPLLTQIVTALAGATPTGAISPYCGSTAPTGYVLGSGKTISNLAGGGTERANADTANLYTLLWNTSNVSPTLLQIQDSSGSNTTRGASAANDYAANKRLPLPDFRGRVIAGLSNLGGTDSTRITIAGAGFDGTTVFNSGGSQTHTLITAELASHTHVATDAGHTHTWTSSGTHTHTMGGSYQAFNTGASGIVTGLIQTSALNTGATNVTGTNATGNASVTNATAGSGTAHSVTQPTMVTTIIIKL